MTARTSTNIKQEIANYVKLGTRNRIVLGKQRIEGLQYLNVGKFVAGLLQSNLSNTSIFQRLISYPAADDDVIGKYIALENIGILLEPELRIDFRYLMDELSKNQCLIILSDLDISETFKNSSNEILGTYHI